MQHSIHRKERYRILKSMLMLIVFGGILLALVNLQNGKYLLASFELINVILASIAIWKIRDIRSEKTLRQISTFFACLILSIMMYAFSLDDMTTTVYIWALLIPLIAYHLTNLKLGFRLTAIFLTCTGIIFLYKHNLSPGHFSADETLDVLLSLLTAWLLTHFYERSNTISKYKLSNIAATDPLTGLRNRSTLQTVFKQYAALDIGIIMFDIDNFKQINDTYGHDVGDEILIKVSECLMEHVAKRDYVFRLGGEEFCVLMPNARQVDIDTLAQRLIQQISYQRTKVSGKTIFFTASAGTAHHPREAENLSDLLKVADKRMYHAKQLGKNQAITSTMD